MTTSLTAFLGIRLVLDVRLKTLKNRTKLKHKKSDPNTE